jgi:uncharacterized membrane protein YedE/YeeE
MFTDWIYGLLGGLLIGLGGLTLLVFNGRIMGASGILGKLIETGQANEKFESLIFLGRGVWCSIDYLKFRRFA